MTTTEPTPEAVEALAHILGQHWHAGMHRGGAPSQWECECDEKLVMSDEAHREHVARAVLAAGYVDMSPPVSTCEAGFAHSGCQGCDAGHCWFLVEKP